MLLTSCADSFLRQRLYVIYRYPMLSLSNPYGTINMAEDRRGGGGRRVRITPDPQFLAGSDFADKLVNIYFL